MTRWKWTCSTDDDSLMLICSCLQKQNFQRISEESQAYQAVEYERTPPQTVFQDPDGTGTSMTATGNEENQQDGDSPGFSQIFHKEPHRSGSIQSSASVVNSEYGTLSDDDKRSEDLSSHSSTWVSSVSSTVRELLSNLYHKTIKSIHVQQFQGVD